MIAPPSATKGAVPVRATTITTVKPRAFLYCSRWHHRWHKAVSSTAMDCDRCGLRWSW